MNVYSNFRRHTVFVLFKRGLKQTLKKIKTSQFKLQILCSLDLKKQYRNLLINTITTTKWIGNSCYYCSTLKQIWMDKSS